MWNHGVPPFPWCDPGGILPGFRGRELAADWRDTTVHSHMAKSNPRLGWQGSTGINGSFQAESMAAFKRNQGQLSTGIGGRVQAESAATFDRNTPYASSAVRKMWGTPWENAGENACECSVFVASTLLLPSSRMEPFSPTTSQGEGKVQHSQPVR